MPEPTGQIDTEIHAVISASSIRRWLHNGCVCASGALHRDWVDAACDAQTLATLPGRRYGAIIGRGGM